MTAKERILVIRLTEKLEKHPGYAKALGIEAGGAERHPAEPKGHTDVWNLIQNCRGGNGIA